jgi:hypothetical protein
MFWFIVAMLIGEYCLALVVKMVFGLKFEPLIVPIVTVVVGVAAFFVLMLFMLFKAFSGG